LKERDDIIRDGGSAVERAEISHAIRMKIKEIQASIDKMTLIIEKSERKVFPSR
jgi:hypothetical protein